MGQTAIFNLTDDKVKNLKCHYSESSTHPQAKFLLFSSLAKFFQLTKIEENPSGKYTMIHQFWVIFSEVTLNVSFYNNVTKN